MTTFEIIMACVTFLFCVLLGSLVLMAILGVVCWVFKTDMDIEIDTEEWEEEQ